MLPIVAVVRINLVNMIVEQTLVIRAQINHMLCTGVSHWLTHAGGKFSTSQGRGVFCDTALDALPADLWRWWLIVNAPESADTDFRAARFAADVNKDLADVFGNLVQRVVRFAQSVFEGDVPDGGEPSATERAMAIDIAGHVNSSGRVLSKATVPCLTPAGPLVNCLHEPSIPFWIGRSQPNTDIPRVQTPLQLAVTETPVRLYLKVGQFTQEWLGATDDETHKKIAARVIFSVCSLLHEAFYGKSSLFLY